MNIQSSMADLQGDDLAVLPVEAPRSRRWLIVGGLLLVTALVIAFFITRDKSAGDAQSAAAAAAAAAPRVTVVVPGRSAVAAIVSATGTIAARREMPVGIAGEGGRVERVLVDPGQWVAAGQTLATIDRSVQAQQAAQLRAAIEVARADAAVAQSELDRSRALVGRGFVSRADLERKTATRNAANARVAVARAQLNEQRASIGRLDVRAPAAGLVLTRAVEPGQIVSAGSAPLFRIAKGGELEMLARLAEQDLARIGVGRVAEVTPVGSARSFAGRVWQVAPVIDPATRQGTVRIALPFDRALRPGGFANVVITSGGVDAPMLPESAVMSDQKGSYVYVVGPGDKATRRDVTIGQVSDAGIAIQSGLSGNEQVVVSAGAFLNPGDKIVPERRAAAR